MNTRPKGESIAERIESNSQRPEILLPITSMVVVKVQGVMRHSDSDYPPQESERDVPKEGAVDEITKPVAPDTALDSEILESLEHKDMEPYKPNEDNAYLLTNTGDEPEGSTAPPERRRAVAHIPSNVKGIISQSEFPPQSSEGDVPKEGAVDEVTKPVAPDMSYDVEDLQELEHKEMEPYKPNEDSAYLLQNNDDEAEGSTAPPAKRRAATLGITSCSFGSPVAADAIFSPILGDPVGFGAGSPPEPPKAQPTIPTPSEGPRTAHPGEPCQLQPKPERPRRPKGKGAQRVIQPQEHPPKNPRPPRPPPKGPPSNRWSTLTVTQAVDPIIDFGSEEDGHQDGGQIVPGILQAHNNPGVSPSAPEPNSKIVMLALKLIDELVISYGGSGGLGVPKPERPKTPPPSSRVVAHGSTGGSDVPRPKTPTYPPPEDMLSRLSLSDDAGDLPGSSES